ncbi:hypothetical protein SK128_009076 [Halocaridina rubra]|uniref:Uncharacterized protein n=1 Tax=Halocaridina rubra TaxID=373956 RepID=A0AAN9A8C2_HALRR
MTTIPLIFITRALANLEELRKPCFMPEVESEAEDKFARIGEYAERHIGKESQDIYDRVRTSPHAFLEWKTNLLFIMKEQFLMTDTCDFSLGREEFYHESVALAVPKDSPFIDLFNFEIKKMQIGGLVQKWKQDFWPKKDKCSTTAYGGSDATRTVSLSDMQGSFFLLFMAGSVYSTGFGTKASQVRERVPQARWSSRLWLKDLEFLPNMISFSSPFSPKHKAPDLPMRTGSNYPPRCLGANDPADMI